MNLDQIVSMGFRPWKPSKEAVDLEAWHEDDVPTIGTFFLHGNPVIFKLIGEPEAGLTTWAYLPLNDDEYRELDEAQYDTPNELAEDVTERFRGRRCVYAVAIDFEVTSWGPSVSPVTSLLAGATDFLRDYVKITQEKIAQLKRAVAEVESKKDAKNLAAEMIHVDVSHILREVSVSVLSRPDYARPAAPSDPAAQWREYEAVRESLTDA